MTGSLRALGSSSLHLDHFVGVEVVLLHWFVRTYLRYILWVLMIYISFTGVFVHGCFLHYILFKLYYTTHHHHCNGTHSSLLPTDHHTHTPPIPATTTTLYMPFPLHTCLLPSLLYLIPPSPFPSLLLFFCLFWFILGSMGVCYFLLLYVYQRTGQEKEGEAREGREGRWMGDGGGGRTGQAVDGLGLLSVSPYSIYVYIPWDHSFLHTTPQFPSPIHHLPLPLLALLLLYSEKVSAPNFKGYY